MGMSKMNNEQFDKFLAGALKHRDKSPQAADAAVERVFKRLSGPLPRQKAPFWRLPAVLLDWQFAPAWPRVAALACCAAAGFVIGIVGLDRRFEPSASPYSIVSSGDLGSIVYDPEPLTGARR